MSQSLLLFTIGPVGQFIEPSRKLKDLYAGSFLLSFLAQKAVHEFQKENVEIILPSEKQKSAPNRIVAKVDANIHQIEFATKVAEAVKKTFLKICLGSLENMNDKVLDSKTCKTIHCKNATCQHLSIRQAFIQQIEHFLEINWVYEELNDDFQKSYQFLMQQMHCVKNTRMFSQINECAGRKCDLYEQYNALFTSKDAPNTLKDNEQLCAIAFVKRHLNRSQLVKEAKSFDADISSVAYMLLKSYLPHTDLKELKEQASEALFDLKNGENIDHHEEYSEEAIKLAKDIFRVPANQSAIGSPYYAIVKLDGDGVGQKYKKVADEQTAKSLSEEISEFATLAKDSVQKNNGICIYAGGEDILAFLPLDTLFSTLETLVKQFKKIKGLDYKGTLSAGIIIAHFMSPLKPLLQQVERLETHAKQIDEEKAAFSIEIIRRSSFSTPLRMKFGEEAHHLTIFDHAITALQNHTHSNSFIHNVITLLAPIQKTNQREMMIPLLRKSLKSSLHNSALVEPQLAAFIRFYDALPPSATKIETFMQFLELLGFLAKKMKKRNGGKSHNDVPTTST